MTFIAGKNIIIVVYGWRTFLIAIFMAFYGRIFVVVFIMSFMSLDFVTFTCGIVESRAWAKGITAYVQTTQYLAH